VERCEGTTGQVGCLGQTVDDMIVSDSTFKSLLRDGVLFYSHSTNCKCMNVTVESYNLGGEQGRAGIHFYAGSNGVSQGNYVKTVYASADSGIGAIRFRDWQDFTSVGDTVEDAAIGILVNQVSDFLPLKSRGVIDSPRVYNCKYSGINVDANAGEVSIANPQVRLANTGASASVASINLSAPLAAVRGGTVIDNATAYGIYAGGNFCRVDNVTCIRTGKGGSSIPAIAAAGSSIGITNNTTM
jgi:hypothetical protein